MDGFITTKKIVRDERVEGYKIQSGLSTLYVSNDILKIGVHQGLIRQAEKVNIIDYKEVGMIRGLAGQERLRNAINQTTINDIRNCIEENNKIDCVEIDIKENEEVVRIYDYNVKSDNLKLVFNKSKQKLKTRFNAFEDIVDFIISVEDKEYKNVQSLLELSNYWFYDIRVIRDYKK